MLVRLEQDFLGIDDTCGLHVTWLERFKQSNLEITVDGGSEKIQAFQTAGQFSVRISFACPASDASQIRRIAVNAKEMVGANLPKSQVWIPPVIDT